MPQRTSKEQILAYIQRLRLVDDVLMNAFFQYDVESAQLMLRIIMDKPELVVREVHTQARQPNPGRRAATLDVLATDVDGRRINVEMQLDPRHASVQRARFYASLMDSRALHEGEDFPCCLKCGSSSSPNVTTLGVVSPSTILCAVRKKTAAGT